VNIYISASRARLVLANYCATPSGSCSRSKVLKLRTVSIVAILLAVSSTAFATVFGNVRGVVHDPQHRPVAHVETVLQSVNSAYERETETDDTGGFELTSVPVGQYVVKVTAPGFSQQVQSVVVTSGSAPVLHYQLALSTVKESVNVSATPQNLDTETSTRTMLVSRQDVATYAGADAVNGFRFITDFVPGAYMVHDQLHVRGGHQVTWAVDGVPFPNTNIASNVASQFSPKDIDYLEAQTGSYTADYGDRTYGVFNVSPRTGFERNRQAELVTSYGNYNTTDDQLSVGDHTQKFAYYASLSGNRSDHGLEPPTAVNLHNQASGGGGFTSLVYNADPNNQFRLVGGFRSDYFQVPNDPDAQAAGIRDREREQDGFATFSWIHNFSPGTVMTVSPFYHFNRAAYEAGQADVPSAIDNRASNYEGGQLSISSVKGKSNFRSGIYTFAQQDNTLFALTANDGSGSAFQERLQPGGNQEALFVQEQYKLTTWLTLNGGLRLTHFSGLLNENAADPRLGVALRVPRLNWVVRGAYSRFYQAPPLDTLSGPLLQFATEQQTTFIPLRGERDEQYEFGLTIPIQNWTADVAYFHTAAHNFFDHDVIGNSNIFFPLTIANARIRGTEATVRSPLVLNRYHAHLAYSNQQAEGFGDVTGGLLSFAPPTVGGYYLDHDQRNTLSVGADGTLPWRTILSFNFNYGSGMLNGDGPEHLPSYRTIDLSISKSLTENLTVRFMGTNLTNKSYMLDTSNTFGGTHFADPRMFAVQIHYRFHY
jgi:outer membrane receptor protein involved in Fe transport